MLSALVGIMFPKREILFNSHITTQPEAYDTDSGLEYKVCLKIIFALMTQISIINQ